MDTGARVGMSPLDWIVIAGYLAALSAVGVWASRRTRDSGEFFVGARRMPVWAVAASVLATATSVATFLGAPEEAYVRDLSYLSTNIGTALAVVLVAWLFIPAFYRHGVTTVYDLLALRFGPQARTAATWVFMIGRVFASGSRVFVAAIPFSLILFGDDRPGPMLAAVAAVSLAGVLTAMFGGIRSVIWTDVLQVAVFLLGAVSALGVLLVRIPVPMEKVYHALATPDATGSSKLAVLRLGFDPAHPQLGLDLAQPYTLLTALLGFSLLNMAAYGTDHDLTQRMLTCRTALRGSLSAIVALLINLPVVIVFMVIGLLLHVYYLRPDLMGPAAPPVVPHKTAQVFLHFILHDMPQGMLGLVLAAILAVAVGSLNSALAAMSATFVNDVYRQACPGRSDRHYLRVGRAAVAVWGLILALFAAACIWWFAGSGDTLIQFVLGAMTFAYAGLLGVFLTALGSRRGNSTSVYAALLAGFLVITLLQPPVWRLAVAGMEHAGCAPEWLPRELNLAFPWRMTVATAVATLVCWSGRPVRPVPPAPAVVYRPPPGTSSECGSHG